jgi:hypothetical protein
VGGIGFEFKYLGKLIFIFETALGYQSGGLEMSFDEKTRGKISGVSVPSSCIPDFH